MYIIDPPGSKVTPSTASTTSMSGTASGSYVTSRVIYSRVDHPNAQSDGKNKLKRIEFEFLNNSYEFALNPETYQMTEPARAQITQTKAGAWLDDFGAGVQTIEMQGTTGFKNGTGDPTNGFQKFKELRDLIRSVYGAVDPGTDITPDKELTFHNYTDGEHWVVYPIVFQLMRSVDKPLLYGYDIQLMCLRSADQPADTSYDLTTTGAVGRIGGPQPLQSAPAAYDPFQ